MVLAFAAYATTQPRSGASRGPCSGKELSFSQARSSCTIAKRHPQNVTDPAALAVDVQVSQPVAAGGNALVHSTVTNTTDRSLTLDLVITEDDPLDIAWVDLKTGWNAGYRLGEGCAGGLGVRTLKPTRVLRLTLDPGGHLIVEGHARAVQRTWKCPSDPQVPSAYDDAPLSAGRYGLAVIVPVAIRTSGTAEFTFPSRKIEVEIDNGGH